MKAGRLATASRAALGVLVAAALFAGLAALSRVPWPVGPPERALVRLSWRAAGERARRCRPPTEEELAALPAHMRMKEVCEDALRTFRLRVWIDDALRIDAPVAAAGARHDRPLTVLHELEVAPGAHRLRVEFRPEAEVGEDAAPRGVPPPAAETLRLAQRIELGPREVVLVTRDGATGALQLRRSEGG